MTSSLRESRHEESRPRASPARHRRDFCRAPLCAWPAPSTSPVPPGPREVERQAQGHVVGSSLGQTWPFIDCRAQHLCQVLLKLDPETLGPELAGTAVHSRPFRNVPGTFAVFRTGGHASSPPTHPRYPPPSCSRRPLVHRRAGQTSRKRWALKVESFSRRGHVMSGGFRGG